eukprot:TRINITY_DN45734_c0_g1_i1.p1 TRINITY_DN45734_c0_g1~~TRINITY_DN45734_c0_g1_i1.p1  ORF type:complete len:516 (-),score=80.92 TRINITY_DN45734_c0_g1_i1:762-2309(-)
MMNMKIALEKLTALSSIIMSELVPENIDEEVKQEVVTILSTEAPEINNIVNLTQQIRREDKILTQCEDMMFEIYKLLDQMKVNLRLSKNEVCLKTRQTSEGMRWFLLPGMKFFKCLCSNPLPYEDLEYVQVNIRRVARHLQSVLLSIDHMWDDTVVELIKQRYPAQVLPKIRVLMTEVLNDISTAFPGQHYVTQKHLVPLELEVEMMLQISNKWRTRAAIKHKKDPLSEQGRKRALKRAAARSAAMDDKKRTPESLSAIYDGLKHQKSLSRNRSIPSNPLGTEDQPPTVEMVEKSEDTVFIKPAVPEPIPEEDNGQQQQGLRTLQDGDLQMMKGSTDGDLEVALLQADDQVSEGGVLKKMARLMTVGTRKKIDVEVTADQREKRRERVFGEHSEHVTNFSEHIKESAISEAASTSPRGSSASLLSSQKFQRIQSVDPNSSMVISVDLVDEQKALSFPESEEGHTQEARWYSFQFSMDELLDALLQLHTAVSNLLEYHLPPLDLSDRLMQQYQQKH